MTPNEAAIIPYEGRPTAVVEQIMKRVVAVNSNTSYRNNNIILIMWIYDNDEIREEILCDWMVERLNRAVSSDDTTNGKLRSGMLLYSHFIVFTHTISSLIYTFG